jgi:hypothetical protein
MSEHVSNVRRMGATEGQMVKATLSIHRATGEFWPPHELGSAG